MTDIQITVNEETLAEIFSGRDGLGELLTQLLNTAVLDLPEKYHQRLRSTNSVERLNEEIRRRERGIRIFPNEQSAIRLVGALLIEKHEQWSTGRKYLDMEELEQWVTIQEHKASKVHQISDR